MQKARLAVHRRCACSGVKALRNTSDARRQAAKLCYRFGPLTPSARSANLIAGDGTKNGFSAPNKELAQTRNNHIQVCGTKLRPPWRAPLGSSTDTQTASDAKLPKSLAAVHRRSACSGVKACPWLEQGALRNTSAARRQAAKLCYRFVPLTPSAREICAKVGDGLTG